MFIKNNSMHIQLVNKKGRFFISDDFDDQEEFLKSLGGSSDFTVYKPLPREINQKENSIKSVLKKLKILTVKPSEDKNNATHFVFTAKESDSEDFYEGVISWG